MAPRICATKTQVLMKNPPRKENEMLDCSVPKEEKLHFL